MGVTAAAPATSPEGINWFVSSLQPCCEVNYCIINSILKMRKLSPERFNNLRKVTGPVGMWESNLRLTPRNGLLTTGVPSSPAMICGGQNDPPRCKGCPDLLGMGCWEISSLTQPGHKAQGHRAQGQRTQGLCTAESRTMGTCHYFRILLREEGDKAGLLQSFWFRETQI